MRGKAMKKRYWRDALWFGLGAFFGQFVFGLVASIFNRVGG